MKISYNKLWKLLIDKNMKRGSLREQIGLSSNTLAKLGKNEPVNMEILLRICDHFSCDIGDIVEFIK